MNNKLRFRRQPEERNKNSMVTTAVVPDIQGRVHQLERTSPAVYTKRPVRMGKTQTCYICQMRWTRREYFLKSRTSVGEEMESFRAVMEKAMLDYGRFGWTN